MFREIHSRNHEDFCLFVCFGATAPNGPGPLQLRGFYEGWNFNSGNYLFTLDTK